MKTYVETGKRLDVTKGDYTLTPLLKRELGDKKTLMGGLNMDVLVTNANREEVDGLIRTTIERMAPGGRFMLYPVPGLYGGCPWEKVEWMIESWKKYA